MEESDEDDATYTKRRSRTTLPVLPGTGVPYTRRSHDMGVKYSTTTTKKGNSQRQR
jgi:hypothetical protein